MGLTSSVAPNTNKYSPVEGGNPAWTAQLYYRGRPGPAHQVPWQIPYV